MRDPTAWIVDEGRSNHGTTFFAPIWPYGGEEGDVLYADGSPTYGWRFLVRRSGTSRLETTTLDEVYRRLPSELRPEVAEAQEKMERIAKEAAEKWLGRRAQFRAERLRVRAERIWT